jgi:hypothetical protein
MTLNSTCEDIILNLFHPDVCALSINNVPTEGINIIHINILICNVQAYATFQSWIACFLTGQLPSLGQSQSVA